MLAGRAWTAPAGAAEVVGPGHADRVALALGQLARVTRNVGEDPVDEAARVGVVDDQREGGGSVGDVGPRQRGRDVGAVAGVLRRDRLAVGEAARSSVPSSSPRLVTGSPVEHAASTAISMTAVRVPRPRIRSETSGLGTETSTTSSAEVRHQVGRREMEVDARACRRRSPRAGAPSPSRRSAPARRRSRRTA